MYKQTVRQIELKEYQHIKLHTFPLPDCGDSGFYRTITSYSAFFGGTKRRNRNDEYVFYAVDEAIPPSKYEIDRDSKLLLVEHNDLLAFFDYIGYDRKKKKIK